VIKVGRQKNRKATALSFNIFCAFIGVVTFILVESYLK
jgi:hypothetical protein